MRELEAINGNIGLQFSPYSLHFLSMLAVGRLSTDFLVVFDEVITSESKSGLMKEKSTLIMTFLGLDFFRVIA
jgi:hypothetical protein